MSKEGLRTHRKRKTRARGWGGGEEGSRERVGGGEKERQRRETLPAQNKYIESTVEDIEEGEKRQCVCIVSV
jgi:hypothetical protein